MERGWYWRFAIVAIVFGLSVYYVVPSLIYFGAPPEVRRSKEKLAEITPKWLPKKRINLGIDLQGGLHLVMGVDTDKAVQDRADRVGDEIVNEMKDKGKSVKSVTRPGDAPVLEIVLKESGDFETLKTILENRKD